MNDPEVRSEVKVVKVDDVDTLEIPREPTKLSVRCFGQTDVGRQRPANEDQFLIAALVKSLHVQQTSLPQPSVRESTDQGHMFIVADGMGGHAAGEEASALAVQSVEDYVVDTLKWFSNCKRSEEDRLLIDFRRALAIAHQRVRSEAVERPHLRGMGTTLTMAYSLNDELFVAHVGDSRCYLMRNNQLYRITQDHTLVEDMIRRGLIKPEDAPRHRWRHVITSTVGGNSADVRVDVHRVHLQAGDAILLCSDGLTEMLHEEQIQLALAEQDDPASVCNRLIEQANAAGGKDNITVLIGRFAEQETPLKPNRNGGGVPEA